MLNGAEGLYRKRAWNEFLATVERGRVLASDPSVRERLIREAEFAKLVVEAEALEGGQSWSGSAPRWQEAARKWQEAYEKFPVRQWVTMKAAVAWLLAGDLPRAVRSLAILTVQSDSESTRQAKQLLAELVKAFPALEVEAGKAVQEAGKVSGAEFELIKHEE